MTHTTQKMKFSIKDFFSKCAQIHRKLRIWSHLLEKSLMENFIFCAVSSVAQMLTGRLDKVNDVREPLQCTVYFLQTLQFIEKQVLKIFNV